MRLVKEKLEGMTLAVGDGANDVSMIQCADVGVGESFPRFDFIKKLSLYFFRSVRARGYASCDGQRLRYATVPISSTSVARSWSLVLRSAGPDGFVLFLQKCGKKLFLLP